MDEAEIAEIVAARMAELTATLVQLGLRRDWILRGYEQHLEELRAQIGRKPS